MFSDATSQNIAPLLRELLRTYYGASNVLRSKEPERCKRNQYLLDLPLAGQSCITSQETTNRSPTAQHALNLQFWPMDLSQIAMGTVHSMNRQNHTISHHLPTLMQVASSRSLRSSCCWPPYLLLWPHRCPPCSGSSAGWLKTAASPTSYRLSSPCSSLMLPSVVRINFGVILIGNIRREQFCGCPPRREILIMNFSRTSLLEDKSHLL